MARIVSIGLIVLMVGLPTLGKKPFQHYVRSIKSLNEDLLYLKGITSPKLHDILVGSILEKIYNPFDRFVQLFLVNFNNGCKGYGYTQPRTK